MKFFNFLGRTVSKFWYISIAFWVILTLALVLWAPNLSDLLSSDQGDLLPTDSPSVVAKKVIEDKFNKNEYKSTVIIAMENAKTISDQDKEYVQKLSGWLASNDKPTQVSKVISTTTNPEMAGVLESKDKKATMIIVGFNSESAAPVTFEAIDKIKKHIKDAPSDMKLAITGDSSIVRDYNNTSLESTKNTTIGTIGLVIVILLIIYRSPVAPLIPLITIGVSFTVSRALVALLAQQGLKIANFTEIFMVVMLFGAGTDYCLFLISRYKEELAGDKKVSEAVAISVSAVGEAIASSAATVIVGMAVMGFAQFGMFNKTGPSLAISIGVALIAGLTLTPALLRMFGRYTFWPVKKIHHLKESVVWDKISNFINRRPGTVFLVTTLILIALAAISTTKLESYDIFSELPKKVDSVQGYNIFKKHYKQGDMLPVTVVIKTKDNMWSANSMNNIYQLTKEIEKLKSVDSVRSVAQPNGNGKDFEGFLVPNQLTQVSDGVAKIKDGSGQLQDGLNKTANGVNDGRQGALALQNGAEQVASGLKSSKDGTTAIAGSLGSMKTGIDGVNSTLSSVSGSLGDIANRLGPSNSEFINILTQKGYIDVILNGDQSKGIPKLADLSGGLQQSKTGLDTLAKGQGNMLNGQQAVVSGLGQTAAGSLSLRDNLNLMAKSTGQLNDSLGQVKDGLDKMAKTQKDSGAGYFYVPTEIVANNQPLQAGMAEYISKDSKYTKLEVILKDMPYTDAAITDVKELRNLVGNYTETSNFNTPQYYIGGANAVVTDMKTLIDSDYLRMVYLVVAGVFIILILLMRGILSPIYLVLTILLSYSATMGITVLVFQKLLGQPGLDWKVPVFMFIMLVALGEDYNILLMSRVKEETEIYGVRDGVRRAVKKTGGIITSAGVIMAGTFLTLMISPLMSMIQLGFAVALGILLDTFIVRPILVPAIIILLDKIAVRLHFKTEKTTIAN